MTTTKPSDKEDFRQLHRYERLHKMMEADVISKDNTLWYYLDHFKADRATQMSELEAHIPSNNQLVGAKSATYDAAYLIDYFSDDDNGNSDDDSDNNNHLT